jgi:hypothetical protein
LRVFTFRFFFRKFSTANNYGKSESLPAFAARGLHCCQTRNTFREEGLIDAQVRKSRIVAPGNFLQAAPGPFQYEIASTSKGEITMNRFKDHLSSGITRIENARSPRTFRLLATTAGLGFAFIVALVAVQARSQEPFRFNLIPFSDAIVNCLPNASAEVTVFPKEETRGVDTLDLKAEGLKPNTSFAVFLTELPVAPFGAVQYIGDFTTNAVGHGSMRVDSIIEEAFSSQVVNGQRVRKELNHVVIWFADPDADELCVPGSNPGPFDGDNQSGVAVLSSKNLLPGAPLP